jgi:glycosyltransferase involved in cell wall biosynthesis
VTELNLQYVHDNGMGYGRFGMNVARALANLGVTVYDHLDCPPEVGPGPPDDRVAGRSNVVCLLSVPSHGRGWWKAQVPVVFTMWEAMKLPESFRENLHRYDTVIVPSEQNRELFSRYHDNVKYVPLGVDPTVWRYEPRTDPGTQFRFLIGGSGARKGTDLAVKAFKLLWGKDGSWGDGPVPWLIMKNPKAEQHYGHRIEMYAGRLSDDDEVNLYRSAHCYLQPSRGEGFGLQPLQAIVQGCPTVLTDAHGHKAFSHLGLPIGSVPAKSSYFIYGEAGEWWEPNLDELCDQMLDVYNNYDRHVQRAKVNAELAREFTWENTARKLIDAIGPERLGPYDGPDEWFTVDKLKYKVVTRRDSDCEIAGVKMFFTAGQEYWQDADIKRIMFEAGILDPICLDDDDPDASGLTEDQVARCGKYRAEHADCPTCGKPLQAAV